MAVMIADTACVDPRAKLADDVEIGPFCIVGPRVVIGRGTKLIGHACIYGETVIGEMNIIHPFSVIGGDSQDPSLRNVACRTLIGSHNMIHEGVFINRGGTAATGETRIGNQNVFQAGVHMAHDGVVGNKVTLGNSSILGPRVWIEDHVTLAPGVSIYHDVTVGQISFVGGQTRIYHDVPPFMLVDGHPARVRCINAVGLRKQRLSAEAIQAIHEAHRLLYRARMQPKQTIENLTSHGHCTPEVQVLIEAVTNHNDGRHGRAREAQRPEHLALQGSQIPN